MPHKDVIEQVISHNVRGKNIQIWPLMTEALSWHVPKEQMPPVAIRKQPILILNFAHEIIEDKKTVGEATEFYYYDDENDVRRRKPVS